MRDSKEKHLSTSKRIPQPMMQLIRSYLINRTFRVKLNTSKSGPKRIQAGVPQRPVLGPLLHIFTSDIPKHPRAEYTPMTPRYADWKITVNPTKSTVEKRSQISRPRSGQANIMEEISSQGSS